MMGTFIFNLAVIFFIIGSAVISATVDKPVGNASGEIITFISILSAAVMSCIFSVSRHITFIEIEDDKKNLFLINNYWIRFFFVCSICAATTILGEILSWPSVHFFDITMKDNKILPIEFDWIGFISLSSLSLIVLMLFVDFPKGIRDLMLLEEKFKSEDECTLTVPLLKDDPNHGKIRKKRAKTTTK